MDEKALAQEFKRLEELIAQSIGATRGLSQKVAALSSELKLVENNRLRDKEIADMTSEKLNELIAAINDLNTTFASMNGRAQGISMTVKAVWAIVGTVVISSILWLSSTIVDLKTQVAVLQSREMKK